MSVESGPEVKLEEGSVGSDILEMGTVVLRWVGAVEVIDDLGKDGKVENVAVFVVPCPDLRHVGARLRGVWHKVCR